MVGAVLEYPCKFVCFLLSFNILIIHTNRGGGGGGGAGSETSPLFNLLGGSPRARWIKKTHNYQGAFLTFSLKAACLRCSISVLFFILYKKSGNFVSIFQHNLMMSCIMISA